ncbi:MAG: T9SS type A sorting domain-containing protein [Ignavibacteriaceae bacterium]|jgi:hypothetical protein
MKTKFFIMFAFLLITSMNLIAQTYPEVSIRDIQYQHPDSLLTIGDKPSPLLGDTVIVEGVVMNPSYSGTVTTLNSGAPAVFLADTNYSDYSGILIRYPNGSSTAFNSILTGTVAKFKGVVTEFNVTTQFDLIEFDGSTITDFVDKPEPQLLTLDSLSLLGSREGNILAEKWEGMYVELRNITTTEAGAIGNGSYVVFDENNTQVVIGNQSRYFLNRTPPQAGTVLEYVRGYVQNRINFGGLNMMMIVMPVDSSDLKIAQFPPVISNIVRDPVLVTPGANVTVTAKIKDPDGTVADAKLYWRKNSTTNEEVVMTAVNDSTYQAVIPSQPDSCVVDFFLTSSDNQGNTATTPSDTAKSRYFYLVLNRPLTIQDVQYSPFGSGFSAYNNYEVTVRGIVTSDTSDIPLGPQVMIQNGTGAWSGIRINGTETLNFNKGDDVTVTGTIIENFSVTNLTGINTPSDFTINSTGNPLPVPQALSTSDINFTTSGTIKAEKWESVLIKYSDVTITDENADGNPGPSTSNFGEILVADTSLVNTRVELQDGNHQYHNFWDASLEFVPTRVLVGDVMDELVGIMYFSFGNYKLIPRTNDDFVNYATDVNNEVNTVYNYELDQNYPNPFNPSTKINYSIQAEGLVSIKVFNILGQEVATLVNDFKTAGTHSVNFDASKLSSGIYLYKIDSNGFTQTKKMMLIK